MKMSGEIKTDLDICIYHTVDLTLALRYYFLLIY